VFGLVNFVEYDDIVKLHIRKASQRKVHSFQYIVESTHNSLKVHVAND
jgi:hypothetical protein